MEAIFNNIINGTIGGEIISKQIMWGVFLAYVVLVFFVTIALFYHWHTYKIPGRTQIGFMASLYLVGAIFFLILPLIFLLHL